MGQDSSDLWLTLFAEITVVAGLVRGMAGGRLADDTGLMALLVMTRLAQDEGTQTPQRLARTFGVGKTTMKHLLDGLAARGLIATAPNPRDRRSKRVTLTQEGRWRRADMLADLRPLFRQLGRKLTDDAVAYEADRLMRLRGMLAAGAEV